MIRAGDRKPFLLEMNTSPGMTGHSLVPKSAAAAGIGYEAAVRADLSLGAARRDSTDMADAHPQAPRQGRCSAALPLDVRLMNGVAA